MGTRSRYDTTVTSSRCSLSSSTPEMGLAVSTVHYSAEHTNLWPVLRNKSESYLHSDDHLRFVDGYPFPDHRNLNRIPIRGKLDQCSEVDGGRYSTCDDYLWWRRAL